MMMNYGYGYMPFFGWWGWVGMVVWWVVIIVAIAFLIRWIGGRSREEKFEKSPLEILKERYARGEIDRHEFEEKKKDLA